VRRSSFLIYLFFVAALAFVARASNVRDIFIAGHVYFVDADCYSRMTRAQMVAQNPGIILRYHDFENAPSGVTPHTTAPMDYLIVLVKWITDGTVRLFDLKGTSVLQSQSLDFAGALISLLLGVGTCVWIAYWAKIMEQGAGRASVLSGSAPRPWPKLSWAAAPFFFAISPILVHGTSLGRPDHQSLIILLLAVALGAECCLARAASTPWMVVSGLTWGVALWVSFYEPVVLLTAVILAWVICAPRRLLARERLPALGAFAAVCAVAWLLEGWHVRRPDSDMLIFLPNWTRTVGELKNLDLTKSTLYGWLGWGCVISPVLLGMAMRHYRRAFPLLLLLLLLFALTCWQLRWSYFLALGFAMTLPWQLAMLRVPWIAWSVFILSLWPMFREWDHRLFPDDAAQMQRGQRRLEAVLLREVAEVMRTAPKGPFIAAWWNSPAIAYWSQQPGVAGSSHESIRGIVDSARFFLAATPEESVDVLRARKAMWVIAGDPEAILSTSATLLDKSAPKHSLATLLVQQPHSVAPFLQPVFANDFFKLFRVDETSFPP